VTDLPAARIMNVSRPTVRVPSHSSSPVQIGSLNHQDTKGTKPNPAILAFLVPLVPLWFQSAIRWDWAHPYSTIASRPTIVSRPAGDLFFP
jgi:hypothetical protein